MFKTFIRLLVLQEILRRTKGGSRGDSLIHGIIRKWLADSMLFAPQPFIKGAKGLGVKDAKKWGVKNGALKGLMLRVAPAVVTIGLQFLKMLSEARARKDVGTRVKGRVPLRKGKG